MFNDMTTQDKIAICDEQSSQVERQIFAQMILISLDPLSVDPSTVAVEDGDTGYVQGIKEEIVAALERLEFIAGIKSSLSA